MPSLKLISKKHGPTEAHQGVSHILNAANMAYVRVDSHCFDFG